MKTIKQIADEIGVSKQAVRDEIAKQGLQSSLRKNGNQFAIDEKQEKLIKSAFELRMGAKLNEKTLQSETQSDTVINVLVKQSEMLQKELEIKNKQIEELNERLAENQKLLDQEQQLHAMTKQELKLLEVKMEKQEQPPEGEKKPWWKIWQ